MLKQVAYFSLIIAVNFGFSPIHAAIGPFKMDYAYVSSKKIKQVVLMNEMPYGKKSWLRKHLKRASTNDFIGNGGIGKMSLWLLALALILAFWGNLIFPVSPLIIILSLACSFILALIGFIIGDGNREKAKITLIIFAVMAIIAIIGWAIALLILQKRGE